MFGLPIAFSADPLGMEGVEHWGWAGDFGVADPAKYPFRRSGGVGVNDACELAH